MFLCVDLLTAFFIGVGRFHEGISNTISSRYQYSSLISFTPFLWVGLNQMIDSALKIVRHSPRLAAPVLKLAVVAVFLVLVYLPWHREMLNWSYWRGTQGRQLLFQGEIDPRRPLQYGLWIGLPPMASLEDARILVKEYNLH
jgi:hypothetical protein